MDVLSVIRLTAPEFASVADDTVQTWISLCKPLVSRRKFGKLWEQALALFTAHRMKLSGVGSTGTDPLQDINNIGIGGLMRVGSYSEGETSISFNNNLQQYTGNDAEFSLTQYGIQYVSLRRMRIIPIVSAGEYSGGV